MMHGVARRKLGGGDTPESASPSAVQNRGRREELLRNFGVAATSRPLNMDAIGKARQELKAELGEELLVEAAGVVGLFEIFTKFVDATGKRALPNAAFSKMSRDLGIKNWFHSLFW